MVAITIKNLPDTLYEQLKSSARTHHRSINGEVIATLEHSLSARQSRPEEQLARIRALRSKLNLPPMDPDEIADAIRQGRP